MPDSSFAGLLAAQGGVPADPSRDGSDLVAITKGGVTVVTTHAKVLGGIPQPIRQITTAADSPSRADVGRRVECRITAATSALTVVTIKQDGPADATHEPWLDQDLLLLQQMSTSRLQIVAGAGVTFLALDGLFARNQGSEIELRHDAANHWVVTGSVSLT